jgi:hypothetical protein
MTPKELINLSTATTGKISLPPSPAYPAGITIVVQRSIRMNANATLPSGQYVAIYERFFPYNPRTPTQQWNRNRITLANEYLRGNNYVDDQRVRDLMHKHRLSYWHASMKWLLKETNLIPRV